MPKKHAVKNAVWVALLAAGIVFMIIGWRTPREEWYIVLEKARNICFQCIGLG